MNPVETALLLLIIVVIAATAWRLRAGGQRRRLRRKDLSMEQTASRRPAGQLETLRLNRNYWGVEIRSGICQAAKELAGRQYPFAEAPCLPLAECTASLCACSYMGLWERRKRHRRKQADRRQSIRYLQNHPERRSHRERRRIDVWRNVKI
jgi:hypothetical protein